MWDLYYIVTYKNSELVDMENVMEDRKYVLVIFGCPCMSKLHPDYYFFILWILRSVPDFIYLFFHLFQRILVCHR